MLKKISVTVITPTIGSDFLLKAIDSVQMQTFSELTHLIVVDGDLYSQSVRNIMSASQVKEKEIKTLVLPYNTGKNSFYGHRIYAAIPHLIDSEYVFFLDEDNWYDIDHIESAINHLENYNLDWIFSLRKICNPDGSFLVNDNCESIGNWEPYSELGMLVDSSCYAFKLETIVKTCSYWHSKWGGDRFFFNHIRKSQYKYAAIPKYSVNYRLDANKFPNADFFLEGNKYMLKRYYNRLPWIEPLPDLILNEKES